MRLTKILRTNPCGNDITVCVLGDSGQKYDITVSREMALVLMLALRQGVTMLPPRDEPFSHGPLLTVGACQPIAVDQQREGLRLLTVEGFEIPLVLNAEGRAVLRVGLDQLDAGQVHDGPVH